MRFERYGERLPKIKTYLSAHGISSLEEAQTICNQNHLNCHEAVRAVQPIAFEDACWGYTIGAAVALKENVKSIATICQYIGEGLQAFAIDGSISDIRKMGLGHGKFAARLLDPQTQNFAFVAGHESFAAAEGAIGVVTYANEFRQTPISVNLLGLGKPAANVISRYKGFIYVETLFDHISQELAIVRNTKYGDGIISCYGAHSVDEGVSILKHANIDTIITGNSTSHIKFTDPTVATYKKTAYEQGKIIFCVASGGGTGRTMHPDHVGAGAASYGMTDTTGRMHSDLQFAGSSSVPAHVEMVGFIGMGNNPIVGATVSIVCLVAKKLAIEKGDVRFEKVSQKIGSA